MLEEDLNDTQLVETASAITSDLGQSEWLRDGDVGQASLMRTKTVTIMYSACHTQHSPYFHYVSRVLLEGQSSYLRRGPLLWVTGYHEDGYFVRPILIKIDNCVELSSSDESWDKLTFNPLIRAFSEHFS